MFGNSSLFRYDPAADKRATVAFGKASFTVLTPRLFRCEWHEWGEFEDRATLSVVNRRLPAPSFKVKTARKKLLIRTSHAELTFRDDGKPFGPGNLSIRYRLGGGWGRWTCGRADPGNLGGTVRTLDGCDGDHHVAWKHNRKGGWDFPRTKPIKMGKGLVSLSGCAVHDDSKAVVLGRRPDGRLWVEMRGPGERRDLYVFAHGHDYRGALADGALIFGRQPLPPRYAFGHWYSRYWAYTDRELEELVDACDRAGIPLDVLVIDMDWHQLGWTGYTWSKEFFPDHRETLRSLRRRGLHATLNLHPAGGVSREEEQFEAVCRDMGLDPRKTRSVPFDCTDPKYMDSYFKRLHHPHEKAGVDFWWMDWQQGTGTKMEGLDPLPWLNHLHWTDLLKRHPDRRPLFFSRFGGLGAGRYPLGFSGDTVSNWRSLAYQPYFTATASNVLYGYWSHDIGGHFVNSIEPELYLRWVQFGIHSPVFRVHSTKTHKVHRRIDLYPEPWRSLMVRALERRYEMVPYISSECRRGVETGLSLVRPMYYRHPERREAYEARGQYEFGDSMLVSPVVQAVSGGDEQAPARAWLPGDGWVDTGRGERCAAGWRERRYMAGEIPVFVRAGAVIPGQKACLRLVPSSVRNLLAEVWTGGDGSYDLHEDDGRSFGYARGEEAVIPFRHRERGRNREVRVGPARGSYRGMARNRSLIVRVHLCAPPESVHAGGRKVPWSHRPKDGHWWYDGDGAALVVHVRSFDLARGVRVSVRHRGGIPARDLDGHPALMRRLNRAAELARMCSAGGEIVRGERLLTELAQAGNRIARDPAGAGGELRRLREGLRRLPGIMDKFLVAAGKPVFWGSTEKQGYIRIAREIVSKL